MYEDYILSLRPGRGEWQQQKRRNTDQCAARRCLRAYEVGQDPFIIKYDLAIKIKTLRTAPPVRNRLSLPHPVASNRRIGVICKEGSPLASQAIQAGAVAAGQETLFEMIREGSVDFTAVICHSASEDALRRADLGRILGPKGLMPSAKLKTITPDVITLVKEMTTAELYREKDGVVRFAIGQLWFSPDMLGDNIKSAVQRIREDCQALISQSAEPKQVFEVVLSSTNGPGFSLNGHFTSTDPDITPHDLMAQM